MTAFRNNNFTKIPGIVHLYWKKTEMDTNHGLASGADLHRTFANETKLSSAQTQKPLTWITPEAIGVVTSMEI